MPTNLGSFALVFPVKPKSASHQRCFVQKGVLRNFLKFTGKHLCQSLFFNKVKKEALAQVFSCKFCKTSKNIFSTEHFPTTASAKLIIS